MASSTIDTLGVIAVLWDSFPLWVRIIFLAFLVICLGVRILITKPIHVYWGRVKHHRRIRRPHRNRHTPVQRQRF
jgi:hypothetical protein